MKIIRASNFDEEVFWEKFIVIDIPEKRAREMCKEMNNKEHPASEYYYKVVDDEYALYEWEP